MNDATSHRLAAAAAVVFACAAGFNPSAAQNAQPRAAATTNPVAAEITAVKRVIAARREYQASLESLRSTYANNADTEKLRWAEDEIKQFHRVPKHAYVLDLDVPGPGLRAEQNIPAANDLYRRAMEYKDRGFGSDYVDNQIRAELLLQQLINQYPSSNKISEAAYQLGDIYESKAYRQYRRAEAYFERTFQWNANTQHDARLRAAKLCDKALNERGRAIELYKAVLAHDTDPKRTQEAQRRLNELNERVP
jgi:tetratricopeptide (TPR) repeat protein